MAAMAALPSTSDINFKSRRNPDSLKLTFKRLVFSKEQQSVTEFLQRRQGIGPSEYASLLRLCCSEGNLAEGRLVHEHVKCSPWSRNRFLGNQIVQMYGKCGSVEDARAAFDSIDVPNIFSWNILLAAYARNGHVAQARGVFDAMGFKDHASWTSMITAYAEVGDVVAARKLFDAMEQPTLITWNAMLAAYAQNGYPEEAIVLFKRLDLEGLQPNEITFLTVLNACTDSGNLEVGRIIHDQIVVTNASSRQGEIDNVLGTALLSMYGKNKNLQAALELLHNIRNKNVVTWTAMITVYSNSRHLQEARDLFHSIPEKNRVTWNSMIAACAQNGAHHEAILVFKLMDLEGMNPSAVSFATVLDACSAISAVAEGKSVHACISGTGLESDVRVVTSLVDFYGKCGLVDDSERIFSSLRASVSGAALLNALAGAYARNGREREALKIFREMLLEGIVPDGCSYVIVLSACSDAGLLTEGISYFAHLRDDFGFKYERHHYVCMADLLARSSWLDEAEELLNMMPFEAPVVAWMTLLSCCKADKDLGRAVRAAEAVSRLNPECSSQYMLLKNMFGGKIKLAEVCRKMAASE